MCRAVGRDVADQWTRFSRPVAKWHVCSFYIGAQCRFIIEVGGLMSIEERVCTLSGEQAGVLTARSAHGSSYVSS